MNLPILLYDIENNQLPVEIILTEKTIFVRSYQNFGIKIVEGTGDIYSAKLNESNQPVVNKSKVFGFDENFGYTLHVKTSLVLELWSANGDKITYKILYAPDDEALNQNYIDKLTNAFLPSYKELEPAILKDTNKHEIIKRLLMDYKSIMKLKGTRKGIEKWLSYVGLSEFKVIEEYITPDDNPTTKPDKTVDRKSGNYYLTIDNSVDRGLSAKNMLIYVNQFENLELFFERLFYALSLANIYFTLPEQDFNFFGINYHSNMMKFLSITNRNYITYKQDPHYYIKNVDIEVFKVYDLHTEYLVKNKITVKDNTKHSVVGFIKEGFPETVNLYTVDLEIKDKSELTESNFRYYNNKLGSLFNVDIKVPNLYMEYVIESPSGKLLKKQLDYYNEGEGVNFVCFGNEIGNYTLTVTIYDQFNNREVYVFTWKVEDIYFEINVFSTDNITEDSILNESINNIYIIESPSEVSDDTSTNIILSQDKVPDDLLDYYSVKTLLGVDRFLTENERYELPNINHNYIVEKGTVMPVMFVDNWLQVIGIYDLEQLGIELGFTIDTITIVNKSYNPVVGEYEYYQLNKLPQHEPDLLFVTVLDIVEEILGVGSDVKKSLFISTNVPSVNILDIYDLYIKIDDETYYSINEAVTTVRADDFDDDDVVLNSFSSTEIPVNHHFSLSHKLDHELNYPRVLDTPFVIESVFPYMESNGLSVNKLGDVILCKLDDTFRNTDIVWRVYNNFDNELVYESTDLELKYRIEDNVIYRISVSFNFNGKQYTKSKIVSAYYINPS